MDSADVLDLLDAMDDQRIRYWLDGGWGVDCLLGEQTRPHSDLDLVLPRSELETVRALLAGRGYGVLRDWLPTTLALRNRHGLEVDLHLVDATSDGGGDQVLQDGSTWHYGAPVDGSIAGRSVKCTPADEQIAMHQGYALRQVDLDDVRRIARRFGLALPEDIE